MSSPLDPTTAPANQPAPLEPAGEAALEELQVVLEPELTCDPLDLASRDAYRSSRWRWSYGGATSAWFGDRAAAIADASSQHPELAIG